MYRKDSTGWIKHVDFIILDLICLQVAFVLAYVLSGYGANPYQLILYRNMAVFMEVADLVVLFAMGTLKNVLKRGYYKDFVVTAQHMDAEERKAELMKDNKLGDGKMFKLDFDPRVIGNKILPDGTHKTGIGDFIRRTSLDEFPQFFNVLRGDMSIIGTRPPLISETNLYELHHRARLAIKPGITGMWQVSGRSDITDFEEVVRLDKEYITNWNIGLDIKILLKTILVVFRKDGSM